MSIFSHFFVCHGWGRTCGEWEPSEDTQMRKRLCLLGLSEDVHLAGNSLWWRHAALKSADGLMLPWSKAHDEFLPWELYHASLPPVCPITDTGSNSTVIGAKNRLPSTCSSLSRRSLLISPCQKKQSAEMTKIIQSGLFHGFHLLLIALPALLEVSCHIVEPSKGTADYFSIMTPIPDGISGRRHLYILHASWSHYPRPCTAAVQDVKYCYCTTLSPFSTTWHMLDGVLSVPLNFSSSNSWAQKMD